MNTLSTKLIVILLSTTTVLFALIFVYAMYDIEKKNKQTSALLVTAQERAGQELLIQAIRITQNSAKGEISSLDDLVLRERELVTLIEDLEGLGKRLGLEVRTLSVSAGEQPSSGGAVSGEPRRVGLSIEAVGSWDGAVNFLKAIETLPQRVMISETNLAKRSDDWYVKADFALYIFD